jgi:hypothetical protein
MGKGQEILEFLAKNFRISLKILEFLGELYRINLTPRARKGLPPP